MDCGREKKRPQTIVFGGISYRNNYFFDELFHMEQLQQTT